ncbi:MAG: sulfite exporter TauE/SafE family protein [Rhodospirillales bacterium]|jgi:uncharacterized protein|nr:sulfite exporter TauE/SafE family protein [Rhodospirillales bacterium]
MEYVAFVALGFVSSIISSVFGFGTALVVLAVGSHILPVKETIALATVLFAASTLTKTLIFRNHIDWKIAGIMAICSLPFSYLGASLLAVVPADALKRLLGVMVLLYLIMNVFKLRPNFRIGTPGLVVGSAAYGFVSGLLGSGNLIKAIVFREMSITKEAFVGAMAATSVLSNFAKLTAYSQAGILTTDMAWPMAGLIASAVMVALFGRFLLRKISAVQFGYGVQIVLAVAAIGLVL